MHVCKNQTKIQSNPYNILDSIAYIIYVCSEFLTAHRFDQMLHLDTRQALSRGAKGWSPYSHPPHGDYMARLTPFDTPLTHYHPLFTPSVFSLPLYAADVLF